MAIIQMDIREIDVFKIYKKNNQEVSRVTVNFVKILGGINNEFGLM